MCNSSDFKAQEFLLGNSLSQMKYIALSGFDSLMLFIGMLLTQSLATNASALVLLQTLELLTDLTQHKYFFLEIIFKDAEAHISILLKHHPQFSSLNFCSCIAYFW